VLAHIALMLTRFPVHVYYEINLAVDRYVHMSEREVYGWLVDSMTRCLVPVFVHQFCDRLRPQLSSTTPLHSTRLCVSISHVRLSVPVSLSVVPSLLTTQTILTRSMPHA